MRKFVSDIIFYCVVLYVVCKVSREYRKYMKNDLGISQNL